MKPEKRYKVGTGNQTDPNLPLSPCMSITFNELEKIHRLICIDYLGRPTTFDSLFIDHHHHHHQARPSDFAKQKRRPFPSSIGLSKTSNTQKPRKEYPWVLSNENLIDLSFGWPLAGPDPTRQAYSNFLVLCNTKPQLEQEEGKKKKGSRCARLM